MVAHTYSLVFHRDSELCNVVINLFHGGCDNDDVAQSRKFDCVLKQIDYYLLDSQGIDFNFNLFVELREYDFDA